jgi:hypothetical protein
MTHYFTGLGDQTHVKPYLESVSFSVWSHQLCRICLFLMTWNLKKWTYVHLELPIQSLFLNIMQVDTDYLNNLKQLATNNDCLFFCRVTMIVCSFLRLHLIVHYVFSTLLFIIVHYIEMIIGFFSIFIKGYLDVSHNHF